MSASDLHARPPIRCQAPAGAFHPCGRLGVEEIAAASNAGLCCIEWVKSTADEEVDW